MADTSLKIRTARTIKWNVIDRVASQVLYAVTGVVLARLLSTEAFGLVGAVLVFQAFASLLVDSGFSYALIQRKEPSQTDYSTVLWFNLGVAIILYIILYFAAPLIADCFQGDKRLIPISRVMFISFIINASAIVQTNRLMKRMDVKMVAISNSIGLVVAGVVGIVLAFSGFGPWAIVWQSIALASVKSIVLWTTERWRPTFTFSWTSLKSYFGVGSRMMLTSFLNTLFLNIYSFFIGNRAGLSPLGYYTQSDKWSKMGIMSLTQVLTSSFLPALSVVQDSPQMFAKACSKMNRLTAYLVFPAMLGLVVMATPIFHALFGTKWDPSIPLFQLLLIRGIFTILTALYNNFLLSKKHPKTILWMEILRDSIALLALILSLPYINETRPGNPVFGLEILLWGQVGSAAIAWFVTLVLTVRLLKVRIRRFLVDLLPYFGLSVAICAIMVCVSYIIKEPVLTLAVQIVVGLGLYLGINYLLKSAIQKDAIDFLLKRAK